MTLFKKLPNGTFTYMVIMLVMVNNIEHLSFVHYSIARHWFLYDWMNYLHSVIVVIIVELSIIELVRRGKVGFAGFFTICLFILCLIYYPLADYVTQAAWGKLLAAIIFSFLFTVSIWYFSILAAEKKEDDELAESYKTRYYEASRSLTEAERKLVLYDAMRIEVEELRILKASMKSNCICPNCNKPFASENAKRGHMATCKKPILN